MGMQKVFYLVSFNTYSRLLFNAPFCYTDDHSEHDDSAPLLAPMVNGIGIGGRKSPANGLPIFNQVEMQDIHNHNQQVKSAAYKAIKRPGRSKLSIVAKFVVFQ